MSRVEPDRQPILGVAEGDAKRADAAALQAALDAAAAQDGADAALFEAQFGSVAVGRLLAGSMSVDEYIESTSYEAGVSGSGWRIDANGDVEFNSGTFRGQVTIGSGTDFSSGYDPSTKETPAGAQSKADGAYNAARDPSNWASGVVPSEIQISGNYTSGSSGWAIDGLGNVEFNDGTFRGTLSGAGGTFTGSVSAAGGDVQIGSDGIWLAVGDTSARRIKFGEPGFGADAEIYMPNDNVMEIDAPIAVNIKGLQVGNSDLTFEFQNHQIFHEGNHNHNTGSRTTTGPSQAYTSLITSDNGATYNDGFMVNHEHGLNNHTHSLTI